MSRTIIWQQEQYKKTLHFPRIWVIVSTHSQPLQLTKLCAQCHSNMHIPLVMLLEFVQYLNNLIHVNTWKAHSYKFMWSNVNARTLMRRLNMHLGAKGFSFWEGCISGGRVGCVWIFLEGGKHAIPSSASIYFPFGKKGGEWEFFFCSKEGEVVNHFMKVKKVATLVLL